MNKFEKKDQVNRVSEELGITKHLAKELLILAGGNEQIVIQASRCSNGLDHCKARILNTRIGNIEYDLDEEYEEE